jgi:hypothetical protein
MIASAGPYPSFFESIPTAGPIMQGLLLLLVISFVAGALLLWRGHSSSLAPILLVWAPSFIGSILAAFQSMSAEFIVRANEVGMVYWSRPDRYIGHIRIYLAIGVAMSLALLCIHLLASRRQNQNERIA